MRTLQRALVGTAILAIAACAKTPTDASLIQSTLLLDAAFTSIPAGFSSAQSSFAGSEEPFMPEHGRDREGPDRLGGLMGGGLGMDFLGGLGFGPGFGRGPFGDPGHGPAPLSSCTFNASSGRVECPPFTHDGITVTRSDGFANASGTAQPSFDTVTTNTVNTRVTITGSETHHRDVTSTVNEASDRTVSGLARGSTVRSVNGTSSGQETTTGTDSVGTFTALRLAGDTVSGLMIPTPGVTNSHPYPTAGTVVRHMKITVTYGGTSTSADRREVITYDGSSTAKVTVTTNGTTKSCTIPLPRGRPTCS